MGYVSLALMAGVLLGVWQFGIGVYRGRISRYTVILISAFVAGIGYLVIGLVSQSLVFNIEDLPEGIVGGTLNVTGTLLLLKAYECGKIGVASGISATAALVPLVFSIYLGEPLTGMTLFGVVLILVGLAMFYGAHLRDGGESVGTSSGKSIVFALGTALFWGLAIIVIDIGTLESVAGTMAISEIPQVAITLVIVLVAGARISFVGVSRPSLGVFVVAGGALAVSNVMFYVAANMGDIGVVSVIGSLSAIVPAILALIFFREKLVRLELGALVVVIIGTSLVMLF